MRAVGIILAGGNNNRMKELTHKRAVAAMPIAGSYRSIDFALSNMTNSHIQKVAVLTQYNARSLNEHLNSSKWWNFEEAGWTVSYLHRPLQMIMDTGIAERPMPFTRIWIS
mgnify:CR=1 FL=1